MKKPLIVIVGPTATGKTALSVALSKLLNGEVVSADSMQIYQKMNIGTAKPSMEEREGIEHWMMDIVDPSVDFSVAQYVEKAKEAIDDILGRSKLPFLVGGTGLYIKSLTENVSFSPMPQDEQYRKTLTDLAEHEGNEKIYQMLLKIDQISAGKIHMQDTKRIVRALEVYHTTGRTKAEQNELSRQEPSPYKTFKIGLTMERSTLYERINLRVDQMLENGLVEEVESLLKEGYSAESTALQGIGYKEIIWALQGKMSMTEAVELVKQSSRRYAKRQLTWFRRDEEIVWVEMDRVALDETLKCLEFEIEHFLTVKHL